MEENMMANEMMEQMAEDTVVDAVSSEKGSNILVTGLKGAGIYLGIKYIGKGIKKLVCKFNPKAKAKDLDKKVKALEKEGYTVTKEQPELNPSDFKVGEDDFE